jgi:kynurenine formamidase
MIDAAEDASNSSLWPMVQDLRGDAVFTDLTHAFAPGQPRFPTLPDEVRTVFRNHRDHEVLVHRYELAGQWGTHVDPPNHFVEGGRSLDQIPASEMVCPLVILDISGRVLVDADAVPSLEDLARYEARWGVIPAGAFVALRTDWYRRWSNPVAFQNRDAEGVAHCPGWSLPVLRLLIEERGIAAVGHDTLDTDPGTAWSRGDFSLERYVLGQDRWQIEALAHLDQVPEHGAVILASWPKPEGGSGFPARAIAVHRSSAGSKPVPEVGR